MFLRSQIYEAIAAIFWQSASYFKCCYCSCRWALTRGYFWRDIGSYWRFYGFLSCICLCNNKTSCIFMSIHNLHLSTTCIYPQLAWWVDSQTARIFSLNRYLQPWFLRPVGFKFTHDFYRFETKWVWEVISLFFISGEAIAAIICFFFISSSPSMILADPTSWDWLFNFSDFYCFAVKICVPDVVWSPFRWIAWLTSLKNDFWTRLMNFKFHDYLLVKGQ